MFRFCDSFDHYDTSRISDKWTATLNSGISIGAGGRHNNGLIFDRSGVGSMGQVSKTLDYQPKWFVGFAFKNSGGPGTPGGMISAVYNNYQQIGSVWQEPDGTLTLRSGSSVIINAASFPLSENVWYYIEVSYAVGTSCGIALKLNGAPIASGTAPPVGVDATQFYQPGANRLVFGGSGATETIIDDLYILDGNVADLHDFLGDVNISCIYPKSDVTSNFQSTSVSNHYSQVNEHTPDDDSTYVYSNNIGDIDTYLFDTVASFSGTIPAVHLNVYCRKDDEGYRAFQSKGVVQNSLNGNRYINDSYNYMSFPDGSSGWSPSAVNGTAFGVQMVTP